MASQAGGWVSGSLPGRVASDLGGRIRKGIETAGAMIVLAIEATTSAAKDMVARKFSWSEFLLQAWFMARVSVLPTILVAIPFGIIVSIQVGGVAARSVPSRSRVRSTASACCVRALLWSPRS